MNSAPLRHIARTLLIALVLAVFVVFAGRLRFDFFGPEVSVEAYDYLSKNLLRGVHSFAGASLPKADRSIKNGNLVAYFGYFPVLVHLPLQFMLPEHFGRLSRLSVLLGAFLSVYAVARLFKDAANSNSALTQNGRFAVWGSAFSIFTVGSPLLLLAATPHIYHETIIWSLALSLFALCLLNRGIERTRHAVLFSSAAAGALLSRVTFGFPFYVWIAAYCAKAAVRFVRSLRKDPRAIGTQLRFALRRRTAWWAALIAPALIGGIGYLWSIQQRYGDAFSQARYLTGSHRKQTPLFAAARIGDGFYNYFLRIPETFCDAFPFIAYPKAQYPSPNLYLDTPYREFVMSLAVAAPGVVALALVGLYQLMRGRFARCAGVSLISLPLICLFGLQAALILSYYFVTMRFSAEFLPLCIALAVVSIRSLTQRPAALFALVLPPLALVTVTLSILTTTGWAADPGNWQSSPGEHRQLEFAPFDRCLRTEAPKK